MNKWYEWKISVFDSKLTQRLLLSISALGTILLKNAKGKWQNNIQILIRMIIFAHLPKDDYHISNMKYMVR